MRIVPDNHNPNAVRPLSFNYPILRRKYLRNYTRIDHDDRKELEWPFVLTMRPEDTVVADNRGVDE